jgi:hypothetical protein
MKRIHFPDQGNVSPTCSQFAHFDCHQFIACPTASKQAAKGVDHDLIAIALLQQKPAHAATGISARLHFAAVRVEDSHKGGGILRAGSRGLDDQQFIAAHSFSPVANPNDFFNRRPVWLVTSVHDNKIVAQTVHLNERSTARDDSGPLFGKWDMWIHRMGFLCESVAGIYWDVIYVMSDVTYILSINNFIPI